MHIFLWVLYFQLVKLFVDLTFQRKYIVIEKQVYIYIYLSSVRSGVSTTAIVAAAVISGPAVLRGETVGTLSVSAVPRSPASVQSVVDITEQVVSLHTLPGHGVGSLRRTEEEEFCLETLSSTKRLTLGVSATFRGRGPEEESIGDTDKQGDNQDHSGHHTCWVMDMIVCL